MSHENELLKVWKEACERQLALQGLDPKPLGPYAIDKGANNPNELDGWFAQINKKGEVICNWNMNSPDYPTPPYGGTLYDADGAKVHCPSPYQPERAGCPHYIFWANLTTGEVRCRSFNPDGSYSDGGVGKLSFITRWLKAPLRYVPPEM